MMNKKLIRTNEGIFELGVEELIPMFDNIIKKFSHKCVKDLCGYEENTYDFDDYYQIGLVELMSAFEKYDHTKGATFFTHFHRELHHRIIMLIREFEAEKRKLDQPLLYINKEVEDGCEISNVIKDKDDKYFEEGGTKLEQFLKKNLTQTERVLIAVHFKKSYNKAKGLYKNSLDYTMRTLIEDENIDISINKSDLAKVLNISRPTLNKRINEAVEKIEELAEYYVHTQQLKYSM